MTDMVARVAEAILAELGRQKTDPNWEGRWLAPHLDEDGEETGEVWLDGKFDPKELARAAIEAMRTPTKALLDAVETEEERRGYAASAYESMDAEAAWPVMISAALKESEEKA